MKPFTESMRYDYPLKPDDLVLDIGGYEGNFAAEIHKRFGCYVNIYEPCREFYTNIAKRFAMNHHVKVFHTAIGGAEADALKEIVITKRGDSSGAYILDSDCPEELSPLHDIARLFTGRKEIALIKLNCEGSEFNIMERILDLGLNRIVKAFQIQFHSIVPDYEKRHDAIVEALNKTHNMTFDAPFVWEGWTLK